MSTHVLLSLAEHFILSLFRNEFNKFNNARARMLDFIYHMTLNCLKLAVLAENVNNLPSFSQC